MDILRLVSIALEEEPGDGALYRAAGLDGVQGLDGAGEGFAPVDYAISRLGFGAVVSDALTDSQDVLGHPGRCEGRGAMAVTERKWLAQSKGIAQRLHKSPSMWVSTVSSWSLASAIWQAWITTVGS